MTTPPLPPYQPQQPFPGPQHQYGAPAPADRVRWAWHDRPRTDYIFDFWTAFGWTLLSCGFYGIYVTYQLVRRSREHNVRRIEMLDAANAFAWQQAQARGLDGELRASFENIALHMQTLRHITTEFRDPTVWAILHYFGSWIVDIILFYFLDGDLVRHDYAEGAVENELATIYERLGAPIPRPIPARLKQPYDVGGRIIATVLTCGIYIWWWMYDVMVDGNRHFYENWMWEDALAESVQRLLATAA